MEQVGAVILGGHFQGLGILRSLAAHNIPVCLLDHELCIGRFSRYRKRFFRCPSPRQEEALLEFLEQLAAREHLDGWVVYPNDDETVSLLAKNRRRLDPYYRIPTPPWESVCFACEKKLTYEIAGKADVAVPRTSYPGSLEEAAELRFDFPAIIKPSVKEPFYSRTRKKAIRVDSRDELIAAFGLALSASGGSEIMVQEFIPGGTRHLYSVGSMFKEGAFLGKVVAQRIRQHPMDFGHATTYARTVDLPEIEDSARRLLGLIGYYGLSEVEFMLDPRDQKYKLLEINPRTWGWHTLAIAAGVDLPYLLYTDMLGESVHRNGFLKDVEWMRLTTDIPTAAKEILRGNLKLMDYARSMAGRKEFAVLSWKDPLPFVAELLMIPYLWKKRGF